MLEKEFQMQIKRSFQLYCYDNNIKTFDYHKHADLGFRTKYDCYFRLPNSIYIGCELKVNRQKTTFNFKALFGYGKQYHEIMELKKDIVLGDNGWVIIAHREGSKPYRAYAVTPAKADEYYRSGKGIKLEQIEAESIELPRKRNDFRNELLYN